MGPRIRTLKPEHKTHRKVGPLSHRLYRLWVGLITEADDCGRFVADADQLRVTIFPYHPTVEVEPGLRALAERQLVVLYQDNGVRYGAFPSWRDHQRINRPSPSQIPAPNEHSLNAHGALTEGSVSIHGALTPDPIRADPTRADRRGARGGPVDGNGVVVFKIPERIEVALAKCPLLTTIPKLHDPAWWQRQLRAHVGVDFAVQLTKAESWIASNPRKAPRKDVPGFLWRWFAKAAADVEAER